MLCVLGGVEGSRIARKTGLRSARTSGILQQENEVLHMVGYTKPWHIMYIYFIQVRLACDKLGRVWVSMQEGWLAGGAAVHVGITLEIHT